MDINDFVSSFLSEFGHSDKHGGILRDNHLQSPLLNTHIVRALNPEKGVMPTKNQKDVRSVPWPFESDPNTVIKAWFTTLPKCVRLCASKAVYDDQWSMPREIIEPLSVYVANTLFGSSRVYTQVNEDLCILARVKPGDNYGHTMGVLSDLLHSLITVKNSMSLSGRQDSRIVDQVKPHHTVAVRHWLTRNASSLKYLEAKLCRCPIRSDTKREKAFCGCARDKMLEFAAFGSVLLFSPVGSMTWYGVPWEFALCWQDTFKSRWLMYKVSYLSERNGHKPLTSEYLDLIYSAGDKLLAAGGNDAYKLVKLLEPLAIGKVQQESNAAKGVSLSQDFYLNMVSAGDEIASKLDISPQWAIFHSLVPSGDWPKAVELYGMYRHWGHPIIDVQDGLLTLRRHSTVPKLINYEIMIELAGKLNKLLLEKYYHSHLEWPPGASIPHGVFYPLEAHIKAGTWPTKEEAMNYPLVWHYVTYEKMFDIPTVFPPELLFDDKSHSLTRSAVEQIFLNARRGGPMRSTSARVIKTALSTDDFNVMELLKRIDAQGLPEEDLVIGLKPKEREVNTRGRMFSLMSFNMRAYVVATEWLIAKYILPVFPEVTMLNSLTDLMEKFSSLAQRPTSDRQSGQVKFNIHLDYTKWNNHQRHLSTAPVFKVIDQALGFKNLVARTHEFFSRSLVYYADDPTATCVNHLNMYRWTNHNGGFEGLRQKGWSVIGALILRTVGERCNQKFSLLIQGDNQVVTLQFDQEQQPGTEEARQEMEAMSRQSERVLREITAVSAEVGLITKPEETWISSGVMLYGKYPVVDGQTMPSWTKKISRMYDTSNDIVPTLQNALSSNVTACLTLAQQGRGILRPIALCYWSLYRCVMKSIQYDQLLLRSSLPSLSGGTFNRMSRGSGKLPEPVISLVLDVMTRDTVIGGLGGCSPIRFLTRQFVDPLCETLTGIKLGMSPILNDTLNSLLEVQNNPALASTVDWKNLIADPTSLNLTPGGSVSSSMQLMVLEYIMENLSDVVKNQSMKTAFMINSRKSDNVATLMAEWSPMVPKFLSNVYDASLYGMVSSIVGRVQNTRSLTSDAITTGPERMLNRLRHAYLRSLDAFSRHHSQPQHPLCGCAYERGLELTSQSWGRSDIVGVRCPHPLEQFKIRAAFDVNCQFCLVEGVESESILLVTDSAIQKDSRNIHTMGCMVPALGSETAKYKPALRLIRGRSDIPYVDRVLSLYDAVGWFVVKDSPVHQSLDNLLSSFTTFDPRSLSLAPDAARGDPCHRYGSPRESMGCFSPVSFTTLTHVSFNTNRLKVLGKGERNRLILFQAVFIAFQTSILELIQAGHPAAACYHIHPKCLTCLQETPQVMVNSGKPPLVWPPVPVDLCRERPALAHPDYVYLESVRQWHTCPLTQLDVSELSRAIQFAVCFTWMGKTDSLTFYNLLDSTFLSKPLVAALSVPELLDCLVYTTLLHAIMKDLLVRCEQHNLTFESIRRSAVSNWVFAALPPNMTQYFGDDSFCTQVIRLRQTGSFSFPMSNDQVFEAFHHLWITKLATVQPFSLHLTQWAKERLLIFKDTVSFRMGRVLETSHSVLMRLTQDEPIIKITKDMIRSLRSRDCYNADSQVAGVKHVIIDAYVRDGVKEYCTTQSILRKVPGHFIQGSFSKAIQLHIVKRDRKAPATPLDNGCTSPLGHYTRGAKGHTSAYAKILSLIHLWNHCQNDGIVCGDGTGGFAGAILCNMPDMRVLYNSLSNWEGFSSQSMGTFCPASILALDDSVIARVVNQTDCAAAPTDLLEPATYAYWRDVIGHYNMRIGLVVCDAETLNQEKWLEITENLISFCQKNAPSSTLIVKGHYSQIMSLYNTRWCCEKVCSILSVSTVWRSPYSQWGKSEVYLCIDHTAATQRTLYLHDIDMFSREFCTSARSQLALVNRSIQEKVFDSKMGNMGVSSYAVRICCTHPKMMGLTTECLEQVTMMLLHWSVFGIQKDLLIHRKVAPTTRMQGAHRSDFRNVAALQSLLYVLFSALCLNIGHYQLACQLWNEGRSQVSITTIKGHGPIMEIWGLDYKVTESTMVKWSKEASRTRPLLSYLGLLETERNVEDRIRMLHMHRDKLFKSKTQKLYLEKRNGSIFSRIMMMLSESYPQ